MRIDNVAELNRVLLNVRLLSDDQMIPVNILIEQCKNITIAAQMPDHETNIKFAIEVGLLKKSSQKRVGLTDNGLDFIELNPDEIFDLLDVQKFFLVRKCYLDGPIKKSLRKYLESFIESSSRGTFIWNEIDGIPFGEFDWVSDHLIQLGVITRTKSGFEVSTEFVDTIADFLNEPKGWTEEQMMEWLKEKKELGNLAEELVFDFEKHRLGKLGRLAESKCVKLIAKLKVSAGYDIESFNDQSKGMKFDRFIEVKGSKGPNVRFIWSTNEIEVAKKLGDKYWIYYLGGIDVRTKSTKFEPIFFQNPAKNLKKDTRLTINPNGMIVQGKLTGKLKTIS